MQKDTDKCTREQRTMEKIINLTYEIIPEEKDKGDDKNYEYRIEMIYAFIEIASNILPGLNDLDPDDFLEA